MRGAAGANGNMGMGFMTHYGATGFFNSNANQ
jgi:hypothetical protein